MNENLKGQDILLVKEKGSNELKVARKDSKAKAANPNSDNPDFLKIDKHGNMLENFFANFKRQFKDPTSFEFFRVPMDNFKEVMQKLQEAFKNPNKPENKEFIDQHRVDPEAFLKKQTQPHEQGQPQTSASTNAIDDNRVDWAQLESIGVSREMLEKTGNLDKLLNWQKTNLLPITVQLGDISVRTEARLVLRETPDGKLSLSTHPLQKEPKLDRPYFGVRFTDEDKQNLLKTGNLGRIAEAEYTRGERTPVFISIDKQTNELVAIKADKVKIPDVIKGVALYEQQKQDLMEGKAVWVDGMTAKSGKEFSAYIQVNADKRGLEFRFDNNRKQYQSQKQGAEQGDVPKTFRKKELTEDQRDSLREGKTVHVDGLTDRNGKPYSGYVTLNQESGRLDFMFSRDYKTAVAAGKVIPDDRHKTQVAINSEGKTNEATKNVKEPLKQEQMQPTEKQAEKQVKKQIQSKPKASKSVKM